MLLANADTSGGGKVQSDRTAWVRGVASVVLILAGVLLTLFGMMLLLASFMAIGPEDVVPVVYWLLPLAAGAGAIGAGVALAKRDSGYRAPRGGW